MSGRRNSGGAATLVGKMFLSDRERRLDNQDKDAQSRREFQQRLQQALAVEDYKAQIQDRRTQQNNANVNQLLQQRQGFQAQQNDLNRAHQTSLLDRRLQANQQAPLIPGAQPQNQGDQQAQGLGIPGLDTSNMDYRLTIDSSGKRSITFTPKKTSQGDPLKRAQGVAGLQSKIQEIEQRNQLAPLIATEKHMSAYPNPAGGLLGGYVPTEPNWLQRIAGTKQRPQAPAIEETDTSFLRSQLDQLMGGQSQAPTQDDLADLIRGIQSGKIRSKQEAASVIQQAGFDPNDPTFQSILNQLQ